MSKHFKTVVLVFAIFALLGCQTHTKRSGEDESAQTETSKVRDTISVDVETAKFK